MRMGQDGLFLKFTHFFTSNLHNCMRTHINRPNSAKMYEITYKV